MACRSVRYIYKIVKEEENAKLTANRDWSECIVIRLASSAFIYYFKVGSQVRNQKLHDGVKNWIIKE